jgi:anti-sigma regulatory factor (Ser/Thr protein kinase)
MRAAAHAGMLWAWGLGDLSENAELVVSELMTNGIRASGTRLRLSPVRLALLSERACVLILVWDASLQPPVRMDAAGDSENGRGLLLVEAFSARWDWYYPPEAGGKVVWALIDGQAP